MCAIFIFGYLPGYVPSNYCKAGLGVASNKPVVKRKAVQQGLRSYTYYYFVAAAISVTRVKNARLHAIWPARTLTLPLHPLTIIAVGVLCPIAATSHPSISPASLYDPMENHDFAPPPPPPSLWMPSYRISARFDFRPLPEKERAPKDPTVKIVGLAGQTRGSVGVVYELEREDGKVERVGFSGGAVGLPSYLDVRIADIRTIYTSYIYILNVVCT